MAYLELLMSQKTSQTTLAKARSICLTQTNLKVKRVKHEQF